jgi:hypothetical protein
VNYSIWKSEKTKIENEMHPTFGKREKEGNGNGGFFLE